MNYLAVEVESRKSSKIQQKGKPALALSLSPHPHPALHFAMSYPNKLVSATFPFDGVLLLNINRPPLNCLNTALWLEIGQACTIAGRDPEVRCIVLASEVEKLFTAGLDLKCV